MAALEQFLRQVEDRVAAARHEPNWQPVQNAEYMAELARRRRELA